MSGSKLSKHMKAVPETGLAKQDLILEALKKMERLAAEAQAMTEGGEEPVGEATGREHEGDIQALVPLVDRRLAAPQLKAKLAKTRALTLKKQTEMKKAAEELRELMASKMYELEQVIKPMEAMIKKATEAIWTANLYLGRDEEIVLLRDGKPAQADTVLYVRQMVLAADEESMILAEEEGGMDARHIEEFDRWLLAKPAHLQQVLPEERGVVVFVPRRQRKEYRDPWVDAALNKANRQSYWLIRNGEKLYRMTTDLEVGNTLVPTKDEFVSFFEVRSFNYETREYEVTQLKPGSYEWIKAEEQAGDRQRHFMRVALVLQGLIDRTPVLHPLPPGGINLLTIDAYESGKVKVITDAEMLLGEGTEPFKDWLRRLNKELRPGMRITGNFKGEAWRYANENERGYKHSRLSPSTGAEPESAKLYQIEERLVRGGLRFRYARTDKVWDKRAWESRLPKTRASCVLYPEDTFILPFDLVSVKEMENYLQLRSERHNYIDMLPLLKSAIAAKKQEEKSEEPFRKLIVGELMSKVGFDYEEASALTLELVTWWKLANRWHRPLVKEPEAEAKALKMIVEEATRRKKAQGLSAESDWLAQGRLTSTEGMLAIFQKPDGTYLGVAEQEEPYLRHYTLAASGRGEVKQVGEWQLPSPGLKRWRKVWASPAYSKWPTNPSIQDYLSGPEKEEALAQILRQAQTVRDKKVVLMAVTYKTKEREFEIWLSPEQGKIDYEHLLTRGLGNLYLPFIHGGWKRTKGGKVSVAVETNWIHQYNWDKDEWRREGRKVLWEDASAIARARLWKQKCEQAEEQRHELFEKMLDLEKSVEQAWEKENEAREYARFIEDYQDPDLWEGHKKTLKQVRMPGSDALRKLTEIAVERGIEVIGLSAEEAREAAFKVAGKAKTFKDEDGFIEKVAVPKAEELAALAHLRYAAKIEPAVEEEEAGDGDEAPYTMDFSADESEDDDA